MRRSGEPAARRRMVRVALAACVLAVGLGTAEARAEPAADRHAPCGCVLWRFESEPIHIRRDGVRYAVRVVAEDYQGSDSLDVSFTERDDPEGVVRNVRHATFSHVTRFDVTSLADARIHPGDQQMGGRGAVDLVWHPSGPVSTTCGGERTSRPGSLDGNLVFETQSTVLGTLQVNGLDGTLARLDGTGCFPRPGECPRPGVAIRGHDGGFEDGGILTGFERKARSWLEAELWSSVGSGWSLYQEVASDVPMRKITLSNDERRGEMAGAADAWFHGSSTYSSPDPSESSGPQGCRGDRTSTSWYTNGTLTEGIRADPLLGPDVAPHGYAQASRTVVSAPT